MRLLPDSSRNARRIVMLVCFAPGLPAGWPISGCWLDCGSGINL